MKEMRNMVPRLFQQLLIRPQDVTPSSDDLEVIGTFNPGVVEHAGAVVLMVRVAERPRQRRAGFTALPRWEDGRVVADRVADDELDLLDPRVVRRKSDGLLRLTFTSHLRVMRSRNKHDRRVGHRQISPLRAVGRIWGRRPADRETR